MRALFGLFLIAGLMAGCTASVSGGGGDAVPAGGLGAPAGPGDFANKVTGPVVEGHWLSGCVEDWPETGGAVYDETFAGQTINRTKISYADKACATESKRLVETGVFRFAESFAGDIYAVDYKMKTGNGTYDQKNNVRRAGASLFVTEHTYGDGVVPDIELKLVAGSAPAPAPGAPATAGLSPFIGQWSTSCTLNSSGMGVRTLFVIRSGLIVRDTVTYSDSPKCARSVSHAETKLTTFAVSSSGTALTVGGVTLALTDAKTLTGDSGLGTLTLIGQPQALASYAPVYAASCPQFAGIWQMNDFYFSIMQDGCERISLTGAGTPDGVSTYYDYDFMPDGQLWTRNLRSYVSTTAKFGADFLQNMYDVKDGSGAIVKRTDKWYLSKDPCNLQNPSGEDYLVRQTWDRDSGSEVACDYYARWN